MPFNLSQIFGGWRRREKKTQKPRGGADENFRRGRAPEAAITADGREKEFSDALPHGFSEPALGGAKGKSHLAFNTLVSPHISEKATMFGDGIYVFKVTDKANKITVKKAVEERYGVKVENVNIANMPGFKKAVVKLSAGETISEF